MSLSDESDLVVAYDDTAPSRSATEFAAERAAETGESVDVVHVGRELTEDDLETALADVFDAKDVTASYHVVEVGGSDDKNVSVRSKLSDVISHGEYEMAFLGNEEYGLIEKFAGKSVSSALIQDHRVPVVVVPEEN